MKTYTTTYLRKNLKSVLDKAEGGDTVFVSRGGTVFSLQLASLVKRVEKQLAKPLPKIKPEDLKIEETDDWGTPEDAVGPDGKIEIPEPTYAPPEETA